MEIHRSHSGTGRIRTVTCGLEPAASTKHELNGRASTASLRASAYTPVLAGITIGALGARLTGRRTALPVSMGGLAGALVAFGGVLAWASRRSSVCTVRGALRFVNAARDEYWLHNHPIDYA